MKINYPAKGRVVQTEEESPTPKNAAVGGKWKQFFNDKSFLTLVFMVGVYIVGTVLLGAVLQKNFAGLITNPAFIIFTVALLLITLYNYLAGKNALDSTFTCLKIEIAVLCTVLLIPWGWGKLGDFYNQHFPKPVSTPAATYAPPFGYVPGEYTLSLDSLETKVCYFPPGITTNLSVDTKSCEGDSLLLVGDDDTLRTWLSNQHWDGHHDSLTLVALKKMSNIKARIWRKA